MQISLVTPSLNQGLWIATTLRSVRAAADGVDVEHWVIDGGSSDETLSILKAQDFARWSSEPDRGQTEAINKGLARCTGDILGYLCADDLLEPAALRRVAAAFHEHPGVDVVYGDGYFLESDSGWKRRKRAGAFNLSRLRRGNFLIQPAVFWRRRVYERFGPFDTSLQYCMDHEFWLRIGGETRWMYLPDPLATCRLHADAKTSRSLATAWREAAQMQARYGIVWKPRLDALWMMVAGQQYYRMKRALFAHLGRRKH
ncbi:MAG: glycosyltransferase family 2 protein [Verrucomicrobiota bacterium]